MSQALTKRQKELLDFIQKYYEKKGISPSLKEMAEALKLSSLSSVHYHLARLQGKNLISRNAGTYRSTKVSNSNESVVEIPLLGTIAAGHPIEAIEEPEPITVPKTMISGSGEHFALRVSGDSMIGDGIFDQDIVVIRKQEFANEGDTIVAIINGNEATLKRLYKERGGFRLQPANQNISPIFTKELLVQGKVTSILRNIENELVTTPIPKNKNYIRSDEYVSEDALKVLLGAILEFKQKNLYLYKSEKILDISILQEIFFSLLEKQGIDPKMRADIFAGFGENISLKQNERSEIKRILSNFNVVTGTGDILGHIYQSIQSQENRKDSGQYYTPNKVVDFIVEHIDIQLSKNKELKIIDPACGSGQFLMCAYDKLLNQYKKLGVSENTARKNIIEKHLFGIDIDPIACILTKANLILKNPSVTANPNIFSSNFLKKDYGLIEPDPFQALYNGIDFVIGNPPWGASLTKDEKKYFERYYKIGEVGLNTFTLFIERSLDFLKDKGSLGFLIPEAYLKIKVHQPSRKQLLSNGEVHLLAISGDMFKKVYAPSLVLVFEKTKNINNEHKILIQDGVFNGGVTETKIPQSLFGTTPDNIFNIHFSDLSTKIIQQVDSLDNKFLKGNTLFVLGIVTGNNKKYLLPKKLSKEYEPIIVGRDLKKFKIDAPANYFIYDKKTLQQIAPREYYENPEKLIYKFIGKNLAFAYDDQKRFSLNNANAIVPNIPSLNIKYILGVLNSDLIQFYYSKLFFTVRVLRSNLERLPILNASKSQQAEVIDLVEKIENSNKKGYDQALEKLNDLVFDLYKIDQQQRKYIKEALKNL
ncbi:MAG TPA: transcriptional repressor LexA [Candidatus Paceibacterota bacterium]|nr:transcriptional repressor LexA [Candidatus Paceibacterota bacterium]